MLDIKSLLSRMTYQPNVEITYDPLGEYAIGMRQYPRIKIEMWVLDARQKWPENRSARKVLGMAMMSDGGHVCYLPDDTAKDSITLNVMPQRIARLLEIPWPITESDNEKEFYDWLDQELWGMQHHEHREWFQVDGEPWNDPHKNGARKRFDELMKGYGV